MLDEPALVELFGRVMAELRERGVLRSANNRIADIAERLVADYYRGTLAAPGARGHDVIAADGRKLQVKSLRHTQPGRCSLSALRSHDFDAVVAVVFEYDLTLREALHIPVEVVHEYERWSETWKAHRLSVTKRLRADERVKVISARALRAEIASGERSRVPPASR